MSRPRRSDGSLRKSWLIYPNAFFTWEIPPTFVLLVGDTRGFLTGWGMVGRTLPRISYYTTVSGNGHLADLALGRIAVDSVEQLHNYLNKVLSYEQIGWSGNDDWEKHAIFGAGDTGDDDSHEEAIINYLDPREYDPIASITTLAPRPSRPGMPTMREAPWGPIRDMEPTTDGCCSTQHTPSQKPDNEGIPSFSLFLLHRDFTSPGVLWGGVDSRSPRGHRVFRFHGLIRRSV